MHEYLADLTQIMKTWGLISHKDFKQARYEPVPAAMMEKNSSSQKPSWTYISTRYKNHRKISPLAQDFFTRLLGAWGEGLIFIEIIWKLGDNWVFYKMLKQEVLLFSAMHYEKQTFAFISSYIRKKHSAVIRRTTCLGLDWELAFSF